MIFGVDETKKIGSLDDWAYFRGKELVFRWFSVCSNRWRIKFRINFIDLGERIEFSNWVWSQLLGNSAQWSLFLFFLIDYCLDMVSLLQWWSELLWKLREISVSRTLNLVCEWVIYLFFEAFLCPMICDNMLELESVLVLKKFQSGNAAQY